MGLKMASKRNWWPYVMGRQTKDDIKRTGAEIHCFRKDDIVKLEDAIRRSWSGPRQNPGFFLDLLLYSKESKKKVDLRRQECT